MVARRSKRRGRVTVDLSDVETRVLVDEGEHRIKVVEITEGPGNEGPCLKWVFEIVSKASKGEKLYYYTSLAPQALWNLRSLLEALGVEIPDEPMDIVFDEMVDAEVMAEVGYEKFKGRDQAKITNFWPVDGEEEEEEPSPKRKRAKTDAEEEEPTPRRRGKRAEADEEEDDEPAPRKRAKRSEPDEEDEPPASRGGNSGKKKAKGVSQDEINEMSQEELEDVIKELKLDCDLGEFRTLRKMRQAVIDSAEEAEVLAD